MDRSAFEAHLLRRVPFTPEELALISDAFTLCELPRKGFLLRAGDVALHDHYVLSGCLRTYMIDRDGREFDVAFAVEDWWVGDQRSLHSGEPSYLFIQALEPSALLRVERRRLEQLYEQMPRMERFFRLLLARAFYTAQDRIHEEHALSVQERLLQSRKRYPWLEQRVPQKHIASYLGITPEFLSKNRRKLLGLDP